MSSNNDPNAWLGLLKWSLSYQDGTEPSGVSTMSDEDRRWLERVVSEGVRDDVKTMTEIFTRLCDYLDTIACERHTSVSHHGQDHGPSSVVPAEETGTPGNSRLLGNPDGRPRARGETASSSNDSISQPQPVPSAVLSTFLAPSTSDDNAVDSSSHQRGDDVEQGVTGGDGGVNDVGVERLERVLNDLEELRDIVEQIDMAATFVKIGGFGRLIALVGPGYRPEKLRLRAASVIATLTKNNPPAQSEFSTSGGHKALLDVVLGPDTPIPSLPSASSPAVEEEDAMVVSPLSFALQRAILHALSCSVMGIPSGEDSLCGDARFQAFLASALAQQRGNLLEAGGEGAKLRSKAAFVLKALVGAPGASVERVKSLWPAILGLLIGLEALCDEEQGTEGDGDEGDGGITDAARETCIEALVASAKSDDGARIVSTLGSRVSTIVSRRRQVLDEARRSGSGTSEEALETAEIELGLWSQWENVCGPAQ